MLEAVKLLAYDVLQQENLTDICYGTVTETEPLKIVLEQKLELTESFLVLSQNVIKHTINYSMRRKDSDENWVQYEMIVEKQLKKGERVILIKMTGGQRYVVIDRVGEEMTENETDTGNTNDNE
ncbi:MAG: DUF2577 domain-containing protein [Firmicutes bacterium]|nr:DUF2577 domain-containing protein [Bacillota bacterium]